MRPDTGTLLLRRRRRLVKRAVGLLLICCKSVARPVVAAFARKVPHKGSVSRRPDALVPTHTSGSWSTESTISSPLSLTARRGAPSDDVNGYPTERDSDDGILDLLIGADDDGVPKKTVKEDGPFLEPIGEAAPLPRVRSARFISPLLMYGYRPAVEEAEEQTLDSKPLLLYLPGFDGTFLSPFVQFPELHTLFDVQCLMIPIDDRSTLGELCDDVVHYVQQVSRPKVESNINITGTNATASEPKKRVNKKASKAPAVATTTRSVYLVGESFGGILAILVSMALLDEPTSRAVNSEDDSQTKVNLQGLTLINAATCYDRSRLALEGPKVAKLNPWIYPIGLAGLLPLFSDDYSLAQLLLIFQAKALPSVIDNACREAYLGRVAVSLPLAVPFMTQEALQWRLTEWLETGCARLAVSETSVTRDSSNDVDNVTAAPSLSQLKSLRTLIIAGEKDATLPSIAEAERLASIWSTNAVVHVVEGAGHASTCGSRVDLAALLRSRFPELRPPRVSKSIAKVSTSPFWPWQPRETSTQSATAANSSSFVPSTEHRTAMKEIASNGKGEYFGMEPRYDNAKIGLSPLLYWNKAYYKKYPPRRRP